MKNFRQSTILVGLAAAFSFGGDVLDFSYDNFKGLQEKGALLHPDVTMITNPVKCFDMGKTGTVEIPNVTIPTGAFTIESRFFLDGYNESDPNISEILAAFDCGSGTEGVDFRVGGGYNYALKMQDVYSNYSDWTRPDASEKTARAAISKSMGEFSIGSGQGAWKEIFTDRCIDLKKWVYMVATWDGSRMQLYLNGHNATDPWRTVGSALPVFIAPAKTIIVGAETVTAWRHVNGKIGFVKIHNKAFSPSEVWQGYRASLGSDRCADFIKVESPRCGEVIAHDTRVKFCVKDSMDNTVTKSGRTYTIQICGDPTFARGVKTFSTTSTDCCFGDLIGPNSEGLDGLLFFRVSAGNENTLSKMAAGAVPAESGTLPAFYIASPSTSVQPGVSKPMLYGTSGREALSQKVVYDVLGRRVSGISGNAVLPSKQGIYFVKDARNGMKKIVSVK